MRKLKPAAVSFAVSRKLRKLTPADQAAAWATGGHGAKKFKAEISKHLKKSQNNRCAYCGTRFHGSKPHRDHIAPKGVTLHPEWTFHCRNLVLACYDCNSDRKGEFDTVVTKSSFYRQIKFNIVHPYLDEPSDHLAFTGYRISVLVHPVNGSQKGAKTIELFHLDDPLRTKERAKDALLDEDVEHLQGKWKRLAEMFIYAPMPQRMVLKIRGAST
ncbi:retron system putative HNH endonuclease [Brevundimonas sp. S1H14]|uniref:retron system putative HNH endonuclease n=1 Tax=Brevundimonas sp. S1H14 TaxID=3078084 RepID=UPI0039E92E56